jgi:hypothetical protein
MSFVLYYHRPKSMGTPLPLHAMQGLDRETIREHYETTHADGSECGHPEYHMGSTEEERINANYAGSEIK